MGSEVRIDGDTARVTATRPVVERSSRHRRLPRRRVLALALAAVLVAAGCGDDDESSTPPTGAEPRDGSTSTTGPHADDVLGPENPAAGETLTIGYIYDGRTDAIDNTPEIEAAQATVEYVNGHLGGVNGRVLELAVCATNQSPSGATDCANEMIRLGVPAVLNGSSGQVGAVTASLNEAGIPFIAGGGLDQSLFTAEGNYVITNGLAAGLGGPAAIARDSGVDRAAIVVIDVPAASGPVEQLAPILYGNAGVAIDIVKVAPEVPDMTPQIQAELLNDPGQFAIIGNDVFCAAALSAMQNVAFDGTIVIIPTCVGDATADIDLSGAKMLTAATTDPESEAYQLYRAVMDTYGPANAELAGVAPSGYQVVLAFVRAMEGLAGDVTPESVKAQLRAMDPKPLPLADGIDFQCNGEQVAIAPNVCSTDALVGTVDADGNIVGGLEPLDVSDILSFG